MSRIKVYYDFKKRLVHDLLKPHCGKSVLIEQYNIWIYKHECTVPIIRTITKLISKYEDLCSINIVLCTIEINALKLLLDHIKTRVKNASLSLIKMYLSDECVSYLSTIIENPCNIRDISIHGGYIPNQKSLIKSLSKTTLYRFTLVSKSMIFDQSYLDMICQLIESNNPNLRELYIYLYGTAARDITEKNIYQRIFKSICENTELDNIGIYYPRLYLTDEKSISSTYNMSIRYLLERNRRIRSMKRNEIKSE